jgi:hypothetical protein
MAIWHQKLLKDVLMVSPARRDQPPITIRSEKALARLRLLTRDGRSQVAVIEEALERMPLPAQAASLDERLAELKAITARTRGLPRLTMAEFDALEYDDNGMPR